MARASRIGDFFTVGVGNLIREENLTYLSFEHFFLVTRVH
jgi:hypothetical protein